jgi:hypothetical protein
MPAVIAALELFSSASFAQVRLAPPLAAKVSVTGPGATSGCEPNGIDTAAPGVVVTVDGRLNTSAAALAAVCVGAVSVAVVLAFEPSPRLNSTPKVVASPTYLTDPALKNACSALAVPVRVRLSVLLPLGTCTLDPAVADRLLVPLVGIGTLKTSVSESVPAFPSLSVALVNSSDDSSPELILRTFGRLLMAGAVLALVADSSAGVFKLTVAIFEVSAITVVPFSSRAVTRSL